MRKWMISIAILIILILVGVYLFDYFRHLSVTRTMRTTEPPPPYISTTKAVSENWQPRLSSVGSVAAINGVNITTQVPGIVVQIHFQSGQFVKMGDPVVQLDDSVDVQNLKNAQAQLNLTRLNFERYAKLYQTGAVAKSDYDQYYAQLAQAQAQVDKALVQISQKRIRAPFSGKIGIRQINLGQYMNPGDQIVSLQSLDPLYVNFSLPQRELKSVYVGQKISISTDAFPQRTFEGKITSLNSMVTMQTRNIDLQATIPNPNLVLYPGLFAEISVFLPAQKQVVTVPQTAVSFSLFGDIVFVVTPTGNSLNGEPTYVIKQHVVKTGQMLGDKIQIKSGIKAGDMVVTSGQLKLRDKMIVKINNSVKLTPPTPSELEGGP